MKPHHSKTLTRALTFIAITVIAIFVTTHSAKAQLYSDPSSTNEWNSVRWSASTNGLFASSWTANANTIFLSGNNYTFGAATTGAYQVGNITVQSNATVKLVGQTNGSLGTSGNVRTITVETNAVLDFDLQSVAGSAGFIKEGGGVFALAGRANYTGGFTLNAGTVVALQQTALGGGTGALTLHNGTIAANANRAITNHGGGVFITGNIQIGALSNNYAANAQYLINDNASFTFVDDISLGGGMRTLTIGGHGANIFNGVISNGGLTVAQASGATGRMVLAGANTYTGGTVISSGTLQLGNNTASGSVAGNITNNGALAIHRSDALILSNVISGTGRLDQIGSGTTTLASSNTFTGATTVSAGALALNAASGSALGAAASVTVSSGATLLLSMSDQVNDFAGVTLSGGTIKRASGVSEAFGNLNLTVASFLDYGSGAAGTLTFGTYTPSSLLTVNNFHNGNKLVFATDLSSVINDSSFFSFDNAITSNWSGGLFTVTAVPEPHVSVLLAVAGLGLASFCLRRRGKVAGRDERAKA